MKNIKYIIFLFCLWAMLSPAQAQQLFPVQVNGVLVPPRALNINIYSTDRSQDLTFFATLTDRDEPFLDVRLRLSIQNKGKEIYRTNPNFRGPLINLRQFQTHTIRGSDLAPYFTSQALVGPNNQGMGSLEIPEGFNRICIEVMGTVREVPVSNKFCVQGNFKLNQPPFLIKPTCGQYSRLPVMQNILFNWRPMHRGSSNSPGLVEYEFTLVQLPPGTSNINDAFESSLRIYQTTTTNPTLFYGPSQPRLFPDRIYAWRVKAIPANYKTSVLFSNDGVSEVCSFSFYEENPGGGTFPGGTGTSTNSSNDAKDKAPPTGCEVYRTDYGPISRNSPSSIPIVEEDIIKVGYFDLEVRSAAPSGGGYSGSGVIEIPMLDCAVNVEFKNLKANSSFRAFQVDEILAQVDPQFVTKRTQMMGGQMGKVITDKYISSLDRFFNEGRGADRLTSTFDPSDPANVNLPVGIDQDKKPIMAIIGLRFTERNAFMTAVSWQPQTEESYLKFGEIDIPFAPFGTKNKSELKLLEKGKGGLIEIIPTAYITFESGRIRGMSIDCNGSQKIDQPAGIKMTENIFLKSGSKAPFYIDPEKSKDELMSFIGKIDDIGTMSMVSMPEIAIRAKTAYVDFNNEKNLKFDNQFEFYEDINDEEWKGIVFDDISMVIPGEYDMIKGNREVNLLNGQIILGPEDIVVGRSSRNKRIHLDDNFIQTWPYSEDSIHAILGPEKKMEIVNYGRIKLPLFVDTFYYKGEFLKNDSGAIYWEGKPTSEMLNMPMWQTQLSQDSISSIIIKKVNLENRPSEYVPSLAFSGSLLFNMNEEDFMKSINGNKGLTKKTLLKTLGVDSLHWVCQNLEIRNLIAYTSDPPIFNYRMEEWEQDDLILKVDNKDFPVNNVEFLFQKETKALPNRLGLRISFKSMDTMIQYTIWSRELHGQFVYEGIDVYTYFDGNN